MKLSRRVSASTTAHAFVESLQKSVGAGLEDLKGTVLQAMAKRMSIKDRTELINSWSTEPAVNINNQVMAVDQLHVKGMSKPLPVPNFLGAASATDVNLFHPILGERLADLGYKQLYLTNVRSLALAPIWKKQRILRADRAQMIVQDKIRNGLAGSISGTISMFMDISTAEIGIIDGQHRAGALMLLAQKGEWDVAKRNVLVEVFPTDSSRQISALFREINAAEPVRLVDMMLHDEDDVSSEDILNFKSNDFASTLNKADKTIGVDETKLSISDGTADLVEPIDSDAENTTKTIASVADKAAQYELLHVLNSTTDALCAKYPAMFKPSSRCKPPHLNADVFRDELFQSGFLHRHSQHTISQEGLLRLLDFVNMSLGSSLNSVELVGKSVLQAQRKATEHSFFLGLDKSWLYRNFQLDLKKTSVK